MNRSKINDKRFWDRWRASGAVETIEDAWNRNPQYQTFLKTVSLVESGLMSYESEARQLAEQYGLPLKALEEALPIGREKKYANTISLVERGLMSYESEARQLAEQYGL
ncbi:MAG: hypothetical protein ACOCXG_05900, partial [Nanoarchaeota archaeon]